MTTTRAPAQVAQGAALAAPRVSALIGTRLSSATAQTLLHPAQSATSSAAAARESSRSVAAVIPRLLQLGLMLLCPRFRRSELCFEFFDLLAARAAASGCCHTQLFPRDDHALMPCEKGVSAPSNLCTEQLESGMVGVGRGIATVPHHMLQFSMSDPEHTSTMLEKSSPNIRGALLDAPVLSARCLCCVRQSQVRCSTVAMCLMGKKRRSR